MVGFFAGYGIFFILSVIGSSILAFDKSIKYNLESLIPSDTWTSLLNWNHFASILEQR